MKAVRNENHLTQQALADQAGIGLRHYQNIENGLFNPSYKVLSAIIHRLAISTDVLFYSDIMVLRFVLIMPYEQAPENP
ncbi:MAG: helix-turn-helix transcriptional regulator [Kineothrix sp.]|nr:helix-turn-helix transcriptional regulator [Kineothrix sp.]